MKRVLPRQKAKTDISLILGSSLHAQRADAEPCDAGALCKVQPLQGQLIQHFKSSIRDVVAVSKAEAPQGFEQA